MDFNQSQSHTSNRAQPEPFIPNHGSKKKKSLNKPSSAWIVSIALVVVVIVLVVFGLLWLRGSNEASQINKKEYQAIFLSNGQVYFGHLETLTDQYAKLTDIFYLQVKQQVQPKDSTSDQSQNIQLVKLGNELHGPEDAMQINRRQIVFWENLKSDGKVTQAIDSYKKNGSSVDNTTTNSTTPTTTGTTPSSNSTGTTPDSTGTTGDTNTGDSSTTGTQPNSSDSSNPSTKK